MYKYIVGNWNIYKVGDFVCSGFLHVVDFVCGGFCLWWIFAYSGFCLCMPSGFWL